MQTLITLIREDEERILERVKVAAVELGYAAHMPATEEGLRRSVMNIVDALGRCADRYEEMPVLVPGGDVLSSPAYESGGEAFSRHVTYGVDPALVFGALTMYRHAFATTLYEADLDAAERVHALLQLARFFDAVLLGFTQAAVTASGEALSEVAAERNRALVGEKNLYLRAFESLPMPMFFVDDEGILESMNAAAAAFFVPSGREKPGRFRSESARRPPPVLATEVADFARGPDREHTFEAELETGKGRRYFEVRLTRLFDNAGASAGIVVILSDVTFRHHAERALRESRVSYQALLANMSVPWVHWHLILDARNRPVDMELLEANAAFAEAVGWRLEDLMGARLSEVAAFTGRGDALTTLAHVARSGESNVVDVVSKLTGEKVTLALYCPQPGHAAMLITSRPKSSRDLLEPRS